MELRAGRENRGDCGHQPRNQVQVSRMWLEERVPGAICHLRVKELNAIFGPKLRPRGTSRDRGGEIEVRTQRTWQPCGLRECSKHPFPPNSVKHPP